MGKLSTPEWILKGYKSKDEWERKTGKKKEGGKKQGRQYKIKVCPKCGSSSVAVVLTGEEGKKADEWECKSCKWHGRNIDDKELSEDEFLEHMEREEGK